MAGSELARWLEDRTGEMLELLELLALAESPSTEPDAQREPFAILAREFEQLGLAVEAVPGENVGDHLLARGAGDSKAQLILGHMDTVWPLGTLEEMPVRLEDGRIHGPGVFDMKAGLVQGIFALKALRAFGRSPAVPPLIFVNTDEEIGSLESRYRVLELAQDVERALVLEPSFGSAGRLKTARKGVGRFTITVKGKASHAGINPEEGASAILEVSHQIQNLFELNDLDRGITVNVGTIDGGLRPNVVAPEVTARVDARVTTAADAERLERRIMGLVPHGEGLELRVEGGFDRPPLERTARNIELWQQAERVAGELGVELGETLVGGASDGNLTSQHTPTLDGLGAVGDGAHAPHEHVIIERIPERAALVAELLCLPPEAV